MKTTLIILVFLLVGGLYGNSSATILEEEVKITVKPDGRVVQEFYRKVRMENANGYNLFGESFFSYNPQLEELKVLKSDTRQKGGAVVSTPKNGILIQSPGNTSNSPDFSFMRELMVSHTGLEPGSVIEFRYLITDKKPFRSVLIQKMGGYVPVLKKRVVIKGVSHKQIYVNGKVESKTSGEYFVENMEPIFENRYFSKVTDLPFVYIELKNPAKLIKSGFKKSYVEEDLKSFASYLGLSEMSGESEIVEKVQSFIKKSLTEVKLEEEKYNFTPRTVKRIFRSGYATSLEKVFLIHSLLKYMKIEHSAGYLGEVLKEKTLFYKPQYYIHSSIDIYPSSIFTAGKGVVPVFGKALEVNNSPSEYSVSLHLKEGKKGNFTGTALMDVKNGMGVPPVKSVIPLKGVVVKNSSTLLKDRYRVIKKAKATYKVPESGKMALKGRDIIGLFHLGDIFEWTSKVKEFNLPNHLKLKIHLVMDLNSNNRYITNPGSEVKNSGGSVNWKWVKDGKRVEFCGELNIQKKSFTKSEFPQLEALITPLLNRTNSSVIVKRK